MRSVLLAAALTVLACSGASAAADLRDTVDSFGLPGSWAMRDCGAPRNAANEVAIFDYDVDGALLETLDAGSVYQSHYRFERAQILGEGRIELDGVYLGNGDTQQIVMQARDGRLRTISNYDVTADRFLVDDGVATANGQPTSWHARCE